MCRADCLCRRQGCSAVQVQVCGTIMLLCADARRFYQTRLNWHLTSLCCARTCVRVYTGDGVAGAHGVLLMRVEEQANGLGCVETARARSHMCAYTGME